MVENQINIIVESVKSFLIQVGQFLPQLFAALVILILGLLIAKFLHFIVVRGLKLIHFDVLTQTAGIDGFIKQGGIKKTTIDILGILVYWLVILLTLLTAFNSLGLGVVSELFRRIALFIPNVIVAVLILAIGLYFARFISDTVMAYSRNVGIEDAELMGRLTRYAIVIFVVITALVQVNIGAEILMEAFRILFGATCLALALAFGIGGQKWAAGALEKFVKKQK
ncbi:MAG TPA: hypothetical protein VK138_17055 [Acidiferrobacterales bacterium]|nr:hypothetical protein [Acidiferrobacterales bacterium]